MRTINVIDICGQLLNRILSGSMSPDKTTEYFFREKRKLIGSKERKFISNTVFTTIRNYLLLKDIESRFDTKNKFNHPNIFINARSNSILILIQIILKEKFPDDFSELDLSTIYYDNLNSIIETIETDLSIVHQSNVFLNNLKSFKDAIIAFYSNIKYDYNVNNSLDSTIDYVVKRFSFKKEFIELLIKNPQITQNDLISFANTMNKNADTCLRINLSVVSKAMCLESLNDSKIKFVQSDISPTGIIISGRHQLTTLDSYKKGYFAIQDIASQMVAFVANPKKNDVVLDACAGAGGKSLHIADLQHNQGKIIAADLEFMKVKEILKRAKLANIDSIIPALWDTKNNNYSLLRDNNAVMKSVKPAGRRNEFDIVVVDVPCSCSGIIRRDPMKKYTITQKSLKKITLSQSEILNNYSKFVRAGGTLIYSTCSVFTQENELIIEKFLDEHSDFKAMPIKPAFKLWNISIDIADDAHTLSLFPFKHKVDGFFIAKMIRI